MKIYQLFRKDNLIKPIKTYKRKPSKNDLKYLISEKDYHLLVLKEYELVEKKEYSLETLFN